VNQTRGQGESGTRPSPPPPLEANDQLLLGVLTSGWVIALIVLLIVRGSLPAGERWWIWTCAVGVAMGLFGFWYVPRLKRTRSRRSSGPRTEGQPTGGQGPEGQSAPRDNGSNTVSSTDTPGRSTRS
jgi:Protein of unknown function (DUF2530)